MNGKIGLLCSSVITIFCTVFVMTVDEVCAKAYDWTEQNVERIQQVIKDQQKTEQENSKGVDQRGGCAAGVCPSTEGLLLQEIITCLNIIKARINTVINDITQVSLQDVVIISKIEALSSQVALCCSELEAAIETSLDSIISELITTQDSIISELITAQDSIIAEVNTCCAVITSDLSALEISLISAFDSGLTSVESSLASDINSCCASITSDLSALETSLIGAFDSGLASVESSLASDINSCCASITSDLSAVETSLISAFDSGLTSVESSLAADINSCCSTITSDLSALESSIISTFISQLALVESSIISTFSSEIASLESAIDANSFTSCCSVLSSQINAIQEILLGQLCP